jgi:hypothetical protein
MAKLEKRRYVVGLYDDDAVLLEAVQNIQKRGHTIANVYTPFPVHHLDHYLGYSESRLPNAAFMFGALGTTLALLMQIGMYTLDWQVNIGGKSHLPLPSFIPITFELTVLIGALGMIFTFWYTSGVYPGAKNEIVDPRQTDDRFVVVIRTENDAEANRLIHQVFKDTKAVEIREQDLSIVERPSSGGGHH